MKTWNAAFVVVSQAILPLGKWPLRMTWCYYNKGNESIYSDYDISHTPQSLMKLHISHSSTKLNHSGRSVKLPVTVKPTTTINETVKAGYGFKK